MTRQVAQYLGAVDPVRLRRPAPSGRAWTAAPSTTRTRGRADENIAGKWEPETLALWRDLLRELGRLRRENAWLRSRLGGDR